jgi:hypothetical protein
MTDSSSSRHGPGATMDDLIEDIDDLSGLGFFSLLQMFGGLSVLSKQTSAADEGGNLKCVTGIQTFAT